jgi:SAM-dependent methyltransferase
MPDHLTPELHELTYSYRDYEEEVTFIELCLQQFGTSQNSRVLDIGCGTGEHMRQFILRGYECDGFDFDPEMIEFAKKKFKRQGIRADISAGDMRKFDTERKYGLAINMLASANFILTNDVMISHLRSIAHALDPGAIAVLEMFHPREYGFPADNPINTWEIYGDDFYLECILHFAQEPLNSVTQTQKSTKRVTITRNDKTEEHLLHRTQRVYLFQEFKALVHNAGGLEMVACFGTFNTDRPLDDSKRSWRMISILRRTEEEIR